ncbi:hypothetical protein MML48_4g00021028 [Holotrichia oblita]|uniref:Uncharacterized protein n=1 Tax=Holotrichia oblita TaxID=644536 RepID=A0ACB9T7Z0_HOLOL|nr:hypothetical protein MML48_4g00021028 [Holotrichia oblita]
MFCRIVLCLSIASFLVKCHPSINQDNNYLQRPEENKIRILERRDLTKLSVKRQDDNSTSEGASLKDLEDSFGGTSHSKDVKQDAPTTPRTGFYFLVDWNSFLELDNQLSGAERRRVSLQFRPKAGDPSRFLSVTVP